MKDSDAGTLLANLLDRLDADAASAQPLFAGVVSSAEREALRLVLGLDEGLPAQGLGSHVDPRARTAAPVGATIELNTAVLKFSESPQPDWMLCLDFGTAKSKAFAATADEDPDLEELELGKADGDTDGSVYSMSSSIWIDDDGLVFAGAEAVRRSRAWTTVDDQRRRRLDSLKQEISQIVLGDGVDSRILGPKVNPTDVGLTYIDAITFYLAYLTDVAVTLFEQKVGTRYVRRRFTLPWWSEEQREWAAPLLGRSLVRSQILADTWHGRWRDGIPAGDVKAALEATAQYDKELSWLLARDESEGATIVARNGGALEPVAAASARVWKDRHARNLMLVVDVGAGTTDLTLFWVVQEPQRDIGRCWPVFPCGSCVRQGGDELDQLLEDELLRRANLGGNTDATRRARDGLYGVGVRERKELLFNTGQVVETLTNDETVTVTLEDFLELDGITRFKNRITEEVRKLLAGVDASWGLPMQGDLTLVLTGGGRDLPMIKELINEEWHVGNQRVRFREAPRVPAIVEQEMNDEFAQEYPQLAVAMGGAMQLLLDEADPLVEYPGGAPPVGRLDRFRTQGI